MRKIISERPTITEILYDDGKVGIRVANVVYLGYDMADVLRAWDYWHTNVAGSREERQGGRSADKGGMDSHIPDQDPTD